MKNRLVQPMWCVSIAMPSSTKGRVTAAQRSAIWSAASLVELAHPKALREEFVQPWELEPLYLRKSDAEINWTAAMDRAT